MVMNTIQLLAIEAGSECNLARAHKKCPSAIRERNGTPLTDDKIVELAVGAYEKHGFRGLVGWHYYNEPTLQIQRILGLMERIRRLVPASRFVLWSNGTIACGDPRMAMFEMAQITDYSGNAQVLRERFSAIKTVNVFSARFDERLDSPTVAPSRQRCLRPFVEIPVDTFGVVHLCCQDWPGEVKIGNVWTDSWEAILEKRREVVEKICTKEMAGDAPGRCLRCNGRVTALPAFDVRARDAAQAWLAAGSPEAVQG